MPLYANVDLYAPPRLASAHGPKHARAATWPGSRQPPVCCLSQPPPVHHRDSLRHVRPQSCERCTSAAATYLPGATDRRGATRGRGGAARPTHSGSGSNHRRLLLTPPQEPKPLFPDAYPLTCLKRPPAPVAHLNLLSVPTVPIPQPAGHRQEQGRAWGVCRQRRGHNRALKTPGSAGWIAIRILASANSLMLIVEPPSSSTRRLVCPFAARNSRRQRLQKNRRTGLFRRSRIPAPDPPGFLFQGIE